MQNITTSIRNYLAHGLGSNHISDIFKEVSKYDPNIEYEQLLNRIQSRVDLFLLNDDQTVSLKRFENIEIEHFIDRLKEKLSNISEPEDFFLLIVYHIALGRYANLQLKRKKVLSIYGEYNSTLAYKGILIPDKVFHGIGGLILMDIEELLLEYDEEFWGKIGGENTINLIDYLFKMFNDQKKNDWLYPTEFRSFIKPLFPEKANKVLLAIPSAHQIAIDLLLRDPDKQIVIWEPSHYIQTIYRLFFDIAEIKRVYFTKTLPIDLSREFEIKWPEILVPEEKFDFSFLDTLYKSDLEKHGQRNDYGIVNTLSEISHECCAVIPESYLFTEHPVTSRNRQELLEGARFKKVISLPEKVFAPYARVKTSIIKLSNDRNEQIHFDYYNAEGWSRYRDSHDSQILGQTKLSSIESLNDVLNSNRLTADTYCLHPVVVPNNAVELKSIIIGIYRNMPVIGNEHLSSGIPVITYKDLNDDQESVYLKTSGFSKFASVDAKNDPRRNRHTTRGSILIAAIGPKIKATVVNTDDKMYCNPNILCINIDLQRAIPEYIALEFRKPYVKEQIERFMHGGAVVGLRRLDLESIKISLPSVSEQRKIAFQEFDSATKIDDSAIKEIIGIIKHRLSTPVATVNLGLKNLDDFISNTGQTPINSNTIIHPHPEYLDESEKEKYSFRSSVKALSSIAEGIQNILKKLDQVTKLEKDQMVLSEIDFKHFVESKIIPLFDSTQIHFEILADQPSVNADETQLEFLLINLIENALKHGKKDNEKLKVVLQLNIEKIESGGKDSVTEETLVLSIANNGKPLPDGFNKQAFIKKFSKSDFSSGNGLGGYIVNKIVANHKGELEILGEKNATIASMNVQFDINLPTE